MQHLRFTLPILTGLSLWLIAMPASAATVLTPDQWKPEVGDRLIVDVDANMGYLLHEDARYMAFPVATGLRKTIRYMGQTYYAETPLGSWVAKDRKIQSDRVMFGQTGRFLRLFEDGTRYTSYGIHSFKYVDTWLASGDRYRSYGCIVVSEELMNIIEATYVINGKTLAVETTYGSQRFLDELALREWKAGTLKQGPL